MNKESQKHILQKTSWLIISFIDCFLIIRPIIKYISYIFRYLYSEWVRRKFSDAPKDIIIFPSIKIINGENIHIGNNVHIYKNTTLSTYPKYGDKKFTPNLIIKKNCSLGGWNHITATGTIVLGEGVVTGKWVTITDNSHGDTIKDQLNIHPLHRPLINKGDVIIGNNVWLGDKVTILPGVTIGDGSIIGANSVVTKSIPSYCVAVGNPAHIVKYIE